jgi:uncharacterized protein DUF1918
MSPASRLTRFGFEKLRAAGVLRGTAVVSVDPREQSQSLTLMRAGAQREFDCGGAEQMATDTRTGGAQVGDWMEVRGLPGYPSRRGQIVELLGSDGHQRYRVRWDERHVSVVYPADGGVIISGLAHRARGRRHKADGNAK